MENTIDISGLDKAEVLKALHDNTAPLGMGILHAIDGDMPIEEAQETIQAGTDYPSGSKLNFDYVRGRPIKTDISGDTIRTELFDRDAGKGAAKRAIESLRSRQAVED